MVIWLALALLVASVLYAFMKEKGVSAMLLALWAIGVGVIAPSAALIFQS